MTENVEIFRRVIERGFNEGDLSVADGRVLGSNFLWESGAIAGVGPITIAPTAQNVAVGRRLMEDVLRRARERNVAGVRLAQAAYHNRSLSLYTKLGFDARTPFEHPGIGHRAGDARIRRPPGCRRGSRRLQRVVSQSPRPRPGAGTVRGDSAGNRESGRA